jgi:hypothetical protein
VKTADEEEGSMAGLLREERTAVRCEISLILIEKVCNLIVGLPKQECHLRDSKPDAPEEPGRTMH